MRMPLGIALGLVGVIGFGELSNYRAAISSAARLVIDSEPILRPVGRAAVHPDGTDG